MFERYTPRARRTIFSARYIARQTDSWEIETEHLLLGLLKEDQSLARRFLGSPWALDEVWGQVSQSIPAPEEPAGLFDLKLSTVSKRVLAFAAEEAERLSNRHIGTEHLLLGLLREEECFAAEMLHQRGIHLGATREELIRTRHDDSAQEKFVRESTSPPEVVELQILLKPTTDRVKDALAGHDWMKASRYAGEERTTRDKLYLLCRQHGLSDWLYDY
jgi:ATP-dependent Clp protease ATP-binding subunit ClpC